MLTGSTRLVNSYKETPTVTIGRHKLFFYVDPDMPKDRIDFIQDGKIVARITGLSNND